MLQWHLLDRCNTLSIYVSFVLSIDLQCLTFNQMREFWENYFRPMIGIGPHPFCFVDRVKRTTFTLVHAAIGGNLTDRRLWSPSCSANKRDRSHPMEPTFPVLASLVNLLRSDERGDEVMGRPPLTPYLGKADLALSRAVHKFKHMRIYFEYVELYNEEMYITKYLTTPYTFILQKYKYSTSACINLFTLDKQLYIVRDNSEVHWKS